jgi:hypothetical protein
MREYRRLTERLFKEYERLNNLQPRRGVESFVIFDEQRGQYILMNVGWSQGRRVRRMTLYVRLRDGKIWIEEDWTEDGIVAHLLKGGVPKEDIILALYPPELRQRPGSAVA